MISAATLIEAFTKDFRRTIAIANGDPAALRRQDIENADLYETLGRLKDFAKRIKWLSTSRKFIFDYKQEFQRTWKDYVDNWEITISYMHHVMLFHRLDKMLSHRDLNVPDPCNDESFENFRDAFVKERQTFDSGYRVVADPAHDTQFDPTLHNPKAVFDQLIGYLKDQRYANDPDALWIAAMEEEETRRWEIEVGQYFDDGSTVYISDRRDDQTKNKIENDYADLNPVHYFNQYGIFLDFFAHIRNHIGISIPDLIERWSCVPDFRFPVHAYESPFAQDDKLLRLLQDAVRAYVVGAPTACVATCRAALELILKQYYIKDHKENGRDGRKRDIGLEELITLADQRYQSVQGRRLHELRRAGNKILHEAKTMDQLSKEEDRAILNYLKTLKSLIERAPR